MIDKKVNRCFLNNTKVFCFKNALLMLLLFPYSSNLYSYNFGVQQHFVDANNSAGSNGLNPSLLVYFTTIHFNNKIRLSWNTKNETGVSEYEIQRSTNGIFFSPIATLTAKNTPGENNYVFFDADKLSGNLFYRIRIKSTDGTITYSDINFLHVKKDDGLKVNPNVVADYVHIFHSKAQAGAKIEVYHIDGRCLLVLPVLKAAVQTSISAANMPAGAYHLVFVNNNEVEFVKFLKQ